MKQKLSLLFALMLSTLTASAYDALIEGIYYNLDSNTRQATVTSGDTKYTGSVTIPLTVKHNGITYYRVTSIGNSAFYNCPGLTKVIIPNSVTSIGEGAFYYCKSLTSVTIPNSVTRIGEEAFGECSGLTSVTIPNSVTSIGGSAFDRCKGLTSVTIPNSVKSIGNCAFIDCSNLTSITIPSSVTEIGFSAFSGCYVEKNKYINNSGLSSIANNYWGLTFIDSREDGFCISNGVLMKYSGSASSIIIPNSVTSIGKDAFYFYSGLTSVTIPNSVTSIGSGAFYGCHGLTSVTIPSSVTEIGEAAFLSCYVERDKFVNNCTLDAKKNNYWGLTLVDLREKGFCINNLVLVRYLGSEGSVTIPNSVTSIGYYAFGGCSGLTSVIIPNNVTTIGKQAFDGCSGLTSVTIPNSVESIGSSAFYGCSKLIDLYCYAEKVPSTSDNAFSDLHLSYTTLHVPEASIESYKGTAPWSGFSSIQALSEEYPEITKCATPTINFESGKLSFSCETEGVKYVCNFSTPSESYESGTNISMPDKLQVSVYAKKDGYENSDVATKEIDLGASGLRGDVNNDGTVNMPDAMFIVNKILNGKFPDE